jgi:hypothetical protein
MGFRSFPEKGAKKRPLQADYGHYMGLNLGLFRQTGLNIDSYFWGGQSNGFTGLFFGSYR